MATEAQINANRINAKASTGPKTEDGKGKAPRNNTKFGLFATNNCVQPHEKQDYDHFCDVLWSELAPLGGIEEVTAAEYVRNAWRLRRCASAEEFIGGWGIAFRQNSMPNGASIALWPIPSSSTNACPPRPPSTVPALRHRAACAAPKPTSKNYRPRANPNPNRRFQPWNLWSTKK